jgi:hypothetical protein
MTKRDYTNQEKKQVLESLEIVPIDGMVDSAQAARILSKRAEVETGTLHAYGDSAIRWRVKTGKLSVARSVNPRLNFFKVEDIFALDLEPQKWHSQRGAKSRPGVLQKNRARKRNSSPEQELPEAA